MTIGTISIIVGVAHLVLLKIFFKDKENLDQDKGFQVVDHDDLFQEEPELDPSWSLLPGNVWHSDDD